MKEKLALGASLVAAITASLCCLWPLAAVLLGLGSFGAVAVFEAWRPYGLGVTVTLLVVAFYLTYRKRGVACADEACTVPEGSRWSKLVLWIATVAIVAFAAFPYYSARLWAALHASEHSASSAQAVAERFARVRMALSGMTCDRCAARVEVAFKEIPGVRSAIVSYEKGEAAVEYDPTRVKMDQLVEAIRKAGFNVKTMTATILIEGMTCAGCAESVRQTLARLDGMKAVEVRFQERQVVLTFDPAKVTLGQLIEAINQIGFKAKL